MKLTNLMQYMHNTYINTIPYYNHLYTFTVYNNTKWPCK